MAPLAPLATPMPPWTYCRNSGHKIASLKPWRPQKVFRGATLTFCLPLSDCWRRNPNGRSQNGLPLLHHKENTPCHGNSNKNARR